jgi:flavin reductase
MTVLRQEYRDGMAQLGAAVNIITTDGPAGRSGMTASAVVSVTDDPPTLAVRINRSSRNNDIMKINGVLAVNALCSGQREVSNVFTGATGCAREDRFKTGVWHRLATGAPILKGTAVSFDCRITDVLEKGTHTIFFAEVEAVQSEGETEGFIYFGRSYHPVGAATQSGETSGGRAGHVTVCRQGCACVCKRDSGERPERRVRIARSAFKPGL